MKSGISCKLRIKDKCKDNKDKNHVVNSIVENCSFE